MEDWPKDIKNIKERSLNHIVANYPRKKLAKAHIKHPASLKIMRWILFMEGGVDKES